MKSVLVSHFRGIHWELHFTPFGFVSLPYGGHPFRFFFGAFSLEVSSFQVLFGIFLLRLLVFQVSYSNFSSDYYLLDIPLGWASGMEPLFWNLHFGNLSFSTFIFELDMFWNFHAENFFLFYFIIIFFFFSSFWKFYLEIPF